MIEPSTLRINFAVTTRSLIYDNNKLVNYKRCSQYRQFDPKTIPATDQNIKILVRPPTPHPITLSVGDVRAVETKNLLTRCLIAKSCRNILVWRPRAMCHFSTGSLFG